MQLRLGRRESGRLPPSIELAMLTGRGHGQHWLETLPHRARLLGFAGTAELYHVQAEAALAAVRALAGLANFASGTAAARGGIVGFALGDFEGVIGTGFLVVVGDVRFSFDCDFVLATAVCGVEIVFVLVVDHVTRLQGSR